MWLETKQKHGQGVRWQLVMKNAVKFIALEKDFIKNLSSCSASAREPLYYERFIYSNALEC